MHQFFWFLFQPQRWALFHRDLIIGHLIWVSIGFGLHNLINNFGFYLHNDTLQGLQRTEDIFVHRCNRFTLVMVQLLGVNSFVKLG